MNILSQSSIALVGATPTGLPFPPAFPDNSVQASFLAVCNIGPCDCYVKVGQTAGVAADATSNLIAAANYQGLPGQLRSLSAVAIGPFITIPLAPGDLFFSAIAVPVQVVAAYTNGTASAESVTVTLDSATGVAVGQTVEDYGGVIQSGGNAGQALRKRGQPSETG